MEWSEMSPRERDALVAEKVMGFACIHEPEIVPTEVVAERFAKEWEEEHGAPCPESHAKSEAEFFQEWGYHPDRWCKHCHHERLHGVRDPGTWHLEEYTTDIRAAWEVVEKMEAEDSHLELYAPGALINDEHGVFAGAWTAKFGSWVALRTRGREASGPHGPECEAPTPPEAIALAALRAKGVEV